MGKLEGIGEKKGEMDDRVPSARPEEGAREMLGDQLQGIERSRI
jgi:hypothetical protein